LSAGFRGFAFAALRDCGLVGLVALARRFIVFHLVQPEYHGALN
jgi:hypothetical protein